MPHSLPARAYHEPPFFIEPTDGPHIGAADIRFCPWCGVPLRNQHGGRQEARSIVANDAMPPGLSEQDSWAFHVCEHMPSARASRTFSVRRFFRPNSEARTPHVQSDTNDSQIDRIFFGVFFLLGLLALFRFMLTH